MINQFIKSSRSKLSSAPAARLVACPTRFFFGSLFGKKRVGGCEREEEVFNVFKEKVENDISKIESIIQSPYVSKQFLLQTLVNCQKIQINDKFFYDSIIEQISTRLPSMYRSQDLVILAVALGMQKSAVQDHEELVKKFYEHCFLNRFVLA